MWNRFSIIIVKYTCIVPNRYANDVNRQAIVNWIETIFLGKTINRVHCENSKHIYILLIKSFQNAKQLRFASISCDFFFAISIFSPKTRFNICCKDATIIDERIMSIEAVKINDTILVLHSWMCSLVCPWKINNEWKKMNRNTNQQPWQWQTKTAATDQRFHLFMYRVTMAIYGINVAEFINIEMLKKLPKQTLCEHFKRILCV